MKSWIVLSLVLHLLGTGVGFGADQREESLQEVQKKIEEQRQRLQKLSGREGSLLQELDRLDGRMSGLKKEIGRLEGEQKEIQSSISQTGNSIQDLNGRREERQEGVSQRLRQMYIHDRPSLFELIMTSQDLQSFRQRSFVLQRWIESDRALIGAYRQNVESLSTQKVKLEGERRAHERLIAQLTDKRRDLDGERRTRAQLLTMVRNQRDYFEKSIAELEQAAKDLQALIEKLRKAQPEADSLFARMRGQLPLPTRGTLEKPFGPYHDPKFSTKLYHKGIDLRAPEGAPIRAVFDGKVVYSGWFTGYGKILIVDHGGGYFSLYAHAAELSKNAGESVVAGETLGTVGETGSLKGPYLYFELRNKGISQDPWPWFAESSRSPGHERKKQ